MEVLGWNECSGKSHTWVAPLGTQPRAVACVLPLEYSGSTWVFPRTGGNTPL